MTKKKPIRPLKEKVRKFLIKKKIKKKHQVKKLKPRMQSNKELTTKTSKKKIVKKSNSPIKKKLLPTSNSELNEDSVNLEVSPYQKRPGEEYMNQNQKKYFRQVLIQWKNELLTGMGYTIHHLQDEAVTLPDISDRATQEEEFSLELLARDRERKLIKKIEETLRKIDNNDYGFCEACGVEIGIPRLEVRPTANLCIDCKTLDEIREKQLSG